MEFPLASQKITEITVTPIPAHYHKMVGRPAFAENIGSQRTEWLVRARTDGGLEGLTVANRFMQQFHGFDSSDGTVRGLISLLREVFLNRHVDEFLEVSDGRVVNVRDFHKQAFWAHGEKAEVRKLSNYECTRDHACARNCPTSAITLGNL